MRVTDEIKSRLDIVDVVGDYVALRKSGSSYSGFCPFHPNSRTPAFVVFPSSQTWRCFGACAEGGDVFNFMMKREGWDFKEALTQLARRAGVELEELSPGQQARRAEGDRLVGLVEAAADYFHQLFLHAPQAAGARDYLAGRALNEATIEHFRVGYALDGWDACRTHFTSQGYSIEDLLAVGLLTANEERGTTYDRFRNRLMIPIRDAGGRTLGFGARTLDPTGVPKYLNSPQTPLFDKSAILFGLDGAKRDIREARQAVIVEGYMDVLQAWQAGFRNVVAQMGTALTERQLALLKRYTKRFVIALDADAAGVQATLRSLEVARQTLDRDADVRFDVQGLVRHEGRLQADIRVVTLPEGEDPDSLIRQSPTQWPELLSTAKPIVDYVIDVVTAELDLDDAKAKTDVAQQVLPLIGDVADPIERSHYRNKLARVLGTDERALRRVAPAPGRRERPSPRAANRSPMPEGPPLWDDEVGPPPRPAPSPWSSPNLHREQNYLRQCLAFPTLGAQVDDLLTSQGLASISEADFSTAEDKTLFPRLKAWLARAHVVSVDELCDSLDEPLRVRVQYLQTLPATPSAQRDRLPEKMALSVVDWRAEQVDRLIRETRHLIRSADQEDEGAVRELYKEKLRELSLARAQLDRAKGAMTAVHRRRTNDRKGARRTG